MRRRTQTNRRPMGTLSTPAPVAHPQREVGPPKMGTGSKGLRDRLLRALKDAKSGWDRAAVLEGRINDNLEAAAEESDRKNRFIAALQVELGSVRGGWRQAAYTVWAQGQQILKLQERIRIAETQPDQTNLVPAGKEENGLTSQTKRRTRRGRRGSKKAQKAAGSDSNVVRGSSSNKDAQVQKDGKYAAPDRERPEYAAPAKVAPEDHARRASLAENSTEGSGGLQNPSTDTHSAEPDEEALDAEESGDWPGQAKKLKGGTGAMLAYLNDARYGLLDDNRVAPKHGVSLLTPLFDTPEEVSDEVVALVLASRPPDPASHNGDVAPPHDSSTPDESNGSAVAELIGDSDTVKALDARRELAFPSLQCSKVMSTVERMAEDSVEEYFNELWAAPSADASSSPGHEIASLGPDNDIAHPSPGDEIAMCPEIAAAFGNLEAAPVPLADDSATVVASPERSSLTPVSDAGPAPLPAAAEDIGNIVVCPQGAATRGVDDSVVPVAVTVAVSPSSAEPELGTPSATLLAEATPTVGALPGTAPLPAQPPEENVASVEEEEEIFVAPNKVTGVAGSIESSILDINGGAEPADVMPVFEKVDIGAEIEVVRRQRQYLDPHMRRLNNKLQEWEALCSSSLAVANARVAVASKRVRLRKSR